MQAGNRMPEKLTRKERLFAFEYLADEKLNPEKAAIRAGYSRSVARSKAYQWVSRSNINTKPHIADFISRIIRKKESDLKKEIKRLDDEITRLCYSDIGEIISQMGGTIDLKKLKNVKKDLRAAIAGVVVTEKSTKIILHSKTKALELKGKRLGVWDKIQEGEKLIVEVIRGKAEGEIN
jgi:phage terminase small subunit